MFVLLGITDRNQELAEQEAGVLQGRGVAVKGRGVARRQGKRGTTKESVNWQSDWKRRVPVKGRLIGRATRPSWRMSNRACCLASICGVAK